jgi:hypothetical protein
LGWPGGGIERMRLCLMPWERRMRTEGMRRGGRWGAECGWKLDRGVASFGSFASRLDELWTDPDGVSKRHGGLRGAAFGNEPGYRIWRLKPPGLERKRRRDNDKAGEIDNGQRTEQRTMNTRWLEGRTLGSPPHSVIHTDGQVTGTWHQSSCPYNNLLAHRYIQHPLT